MPWYVVRSTTVVSTGIEPAPAASKGRRRCWVPGFGVRRETVEKLCSPASRVSQHKGGGGGAFPGERYGRPRSRGSATASVHLGSSVLIVALVMATAACGGRGGPQPVRSELPRFLADRVVTSAAIVAAPTREFLTDVFVLQGGDLEARLRVWLDCLGEGKPVEDLSDEHGRLYAVPASGGLIYAGEWGNFEFYDPVGAGLLEVEPELDPRVLWVVTIERTRIDAERADPCWDLEGRRARGFGGRRAGCDPSR